MVTTKHLSKEAKSTSSGARKTYSVHVMAATKNSRPRAKRAAPKKASKSTRPAFGAVGIFDVELSKAEYWVENGTCHLRSLEFDVETEGKVFEKVLPEFISAIMKFARHLSDLKESIYSREEDMLHALTPRLVEIAQKAVWDDLDVRPSECGWWITQDHEGAWPRGAYLHGRACGN